MTSDDRHSLAEVARLTVAGRIPVPPIVRLFGAEIVSCADGRAELTMTVSERFYNAMGILHGGVFCDFADIAMGFALASRITDASTFVTLHLQSSYLRPIRSGTLRAFATVVHHSKTIALVECELVDEDDRPTARLLSTCLIKAPGTTT